MRRIATDGVATWSVCLRVYVMEIITAKMAEPIEMPFGRQTRRVGPIKPCGAHFGATWRIRRNDPCAAAMRPYSQITFNSLVLMFTFNMVKILLQGNDKF